MNWIDYLFHVPLIQATTFVYVNNLETMTNWEVKEVTHNKTKITLRFNNVFRPKDDLGLGDRAPHFICLNKPVATLRSGKSISYRGSFKLTWRNAKERPSYIATSGFMLNVNGDDPTQIDYLKAEHIFIGGGFEQPRPSSIYLRDFCWELRDNTGPTWTDSDALFPGINGQGPKLNEDFEGPFDVMDDKFFMNPVDHMIFLNYFEQLHKKDL